MRIIPILSICLLSVLNGFSQSEVSINSLIRHLNDFPLKFRSFAIKELDFKFKDTHNYEGGLMAEDEFVGSDSMVMIKGYFAPTIIAAKGKGLKPIYYLEGKKNSKKFYDDYISKYINNPDPSNDIWESIKIRNISEEKGKKIIDELALLGAIEVYPCFNIAGKTSNNLPKQKTYFCLNETFSISVNILKAEKTTYELVIYKSTD